MNYSNHRLTLDIHNTASQVTIRVKKGDNNRRICAVLTENGKPYKITEGVSAVFRAKKPADSNGNRAIVYNAVDEIKDNTIFYTLVGDYTNVAGVSDCEFTLSKNGKVLTSPRFTIIIDNTVNTDEEVEEVGKNELTALTSLLTETTALRDEVESKLENGEFVGEQGVPGVKGDNGDRGEKGDPGYTPVKGKDYYTEADKAEMLNVLSTPFANAIKGEISGDVVNIYDISPVVHTVGCKVAGKNLMDSNLLLEWFDKQGDGSYISSVTVPATRIPFNLPEGVYTLSIMLKSPENCNYRPTVVYTDDTLESFFKKSTGEYILHSGVTNGKAIKALYLDYSVPSDNVQFKGFQIEEGTSATEYEPYINPTTVTLTVQDDNGESVATYTPNADGTVEITSVSPSMTLMTDTEGAIIECEYNRDANMVLEHLYYEVADILYRMEELFGSAVSRISYIDLPAAGWQGSESPYHQVITDLYGITEYSKVDLNPSVDQLDIFHEKDIAFVTENEGGVVTVYCIGQKPADDYYMQVSITEVMTID